MVNFPFLVKFEVSPTWRRFSPSAHLPRAELAFPRVRGPYPARALKEKCFSRGLSQLLFYYFGDGCGGQAHCWSILTLASPGKFPGLTRILKKHARLRPGLTRVLKKDARARAASAPAVLPGLTRILKKDARARLFCGGRGKGKVPGRARTHPPCNSREQNFFACGVPGELSAGQLWMFFGGPISFCRLL